MVLAYRNVRVLEQAAIVQPYFPLVRVAVAADVVLFRPRAGMRLGKALRPLDALVGGGGRQQGRRLVRGPVIGVGARSGPQRRSRPGAILVRCTRRRRRTVTPLPPPRPPAAPQWAW